MKFTIDERLKHRLTGLVVIVSIAIIFVPAMIKRSNQRLEESINVSIQLPPKPVAPVVNISKQKTVFDAVRVARIDIPAVVEPVSRRPSEIAKIVEPLPKKVIKPSVISRTELSKNLAKTIAVKEGLYAVQLASFGSQANAQALVAKLRTRGYQASYKKITTRQGAFYKVVVGQLAKRNDAELLQKKIAQNMQLKGFVVQ